MENIVTIIGARPQFIKAATVSRAIKKHHGIQEIIVHTGQHYDANMSDIFFEQMAIPKPDYNLGVGGGTHGVMTGRQLEKIEEVLLAEKPDLVMVYGDTNSTLAGALAAVKLHMPVAHVEAGLRSFNRSMPEEINRVLTDHVSSMLFCPTETAVKNLINEGVEGSSGPRQSIKGRPQVFNVGDVMYDAALFYKERAVKPNWFDLIGVSVDEFALCTIHRAENTDNKDRLLSIFNGLGDSGLPVVLPLHPRTGQKIIQYQIVPAPNIHLVEPVGYLEMVWLEENCKLVVTDSGGVQKEAFFHGKPCVTLRDETEWVELVDLGWNRLACPDRDYISGEITNALRTKGRDGQPYGTGNAAVNIVNLLNSDMLAR